MEMKEDVTEEAPEVSAPGDVEEVSNQDAAMPPILTAAKKIGKVMAKGKKHSKGKGRKHTKPKANATSHVTHPPWVNMITGAVEALADRGGSSVSAIKKYIAAHHEVNVDTSAPYMKKAFKDGIANGTLSQVKGTGLVGSYKMGKGKAAAKKHKPKDKSKKKHKPAEKGKKHKPKDKGKKKHKPAEKGKKHKPKDMGKKKHKPAEKGKKHKPKDKSKKKHKPADKKKGGAPSKSKTPKNVAKVPRDPSPAPVAPPAATAADPPAVVNPVAGVLRNGKMFGSKAVPTTKSPSLKATPRPSEKKSLKRKANESNTVDAKKTAETSEELTLFGETLQEE